MPDKGEWFRLGRLDERHTKVRKDRCYEAEHVLEWQTLMRFIDEDKSKGPNSLCAFLYKFYEDDIPKDKYKVKVAKKKGELGPNDRAEYEDLDYDLSQWKFERPEKKGKKKQPAMTIPTLKAIDYIGM